MIMLFISDDKRRPIQLLRYCRLNINLALTDSNRTDVEFYVYFLQSRFLSCATTWFFMRSFTTMR